MKKTLNKRGLVLSNPNIKNEVVTNIPKDLLESFEKEYDAFVKGSISEEMFYEAYVKYELMNLIRSGALDDNAYLIHLLQNDPEVNEKPLDFLFMWHSHNNNTNGYSNMLMKRHLYDIIIEEVSLPMLDVALTSAGLCQVSSEQAYEAVISYCTDGIDSVKDSFFEDVKNSESLDMDAYLGDNKAIMDAILDFYKFESAPWNQ